MRKNWRFPALSPLLLIHALAGARVAVQSGSARGALRGTVTVRTTGSPLDHATVRIMQLRRMMEAGDDGGYEFKDVPAGTYDIAADMHALADPKHSIVVKAGEVAVADFQLDLATIHSTSPNAASASGGCSATTSPPAWRPCRRPSPGTLSRCSDPRSIRSGV